MNIATSIKSKVDRINTGKVFTYDSLSIPQNEFSAAAKALSRLAARGVIKRYKNGMYYKPKQTIFGEIKPSEEELLYNYLFENGKQIAYITGLRLYNELGLTTQIPTSVRVASWDKVIKTRIGNLVVKSAKSYVPVSKENIPFLQLLDVMKDFKKIPDMDKKKGVDFLKKKIKELSDTDKIKLVNFAKSYPPKVRAFLGALLESISYKEVSEPLKNTINYLSNYEFGISEKILTTSSNWNIS
ncbi:DUF6088 family protein [Salegentibacter sp. JZCK2]|uniref:DUF6088 family protein n=1 Tax=Salegentibacter tibetensis TaxID=2873600 RepID=UPI001CCB5D17|nr:DUF6088 family protein [Salegentibacter tibetensis]MBZ9730748.1 DUF6088 family protein [Salegentibacter tibetensis]